MRISTTTRKVVISFLCFSILLSSVDSVAFAKVFIQDNIITPSDAYEVWLDEYHMFNWSNCEENGVLFGTFKVINGSDVDFIICDIDTYSILREGNEVDIPYLRSDISSLNYSFSIPYKGTWCIVFRNDNSQSRVLVRGTIDYSPPSMALEQVIMQGLSVSVVIVLLIVVIIKLKSRKN